MSKVLLVKSSILGEHSKSSALLDQFAEKWKQKDAAASFVVRDLAAQPLPILDGEMALGLRGGQNLSAHQQAALDLSNALIEEVKSADYVVVAVPMYNFSIPVQLKTWIDLICRAGVTFSYTAAGPNGLITGKKVLIVTTTGGAHRNTATDLALAQAQAVFNLIGLKDASVAYAEALNISPEAAEAGLKEATRAIDAFIAAN